MMKLWCIVKLIQVKLNNESEFASKIRFQYPDISTQMGTIYQKIDVLFQDIFMLKIQEAVILTPSSNMKGW